METQEMKEVMKALAEPFDPREVDFKIQSQGKNGKALVVPYVDARTVMDRLDQVVGPEGWHDAYEVLADRESGGNRVVEVRCRLTVLGITKEDVGEGDSLKAAFSDALKRAAVKFGVGRYLYGLDKVWVQVEGNFLSDSQIDKLRARLPRPGKPAEKPARAEERAEAREEEVAERLKKADEAISRLVGELKAQGKGAEAAKVLTALGYKVGEPGSTAEDLERAKKVYRALEALKP